MPDIQDGAASAPAGDQGESQAPNAATDQTGSAPVEIGSDADASQQNAKEPADDDGADKDGSGDQAKKADNRVQKRIDKLTRRTRELERELAMVRADNGKPHQQEQQSSEPKKPRLEDFGSYDEWQEALLDYKVEQRDKAKENRQRQQAQERTQAELHQQRKERFLESSEAAAEKYDDFEDVVYAESNRVTPVMAALIADTDNPGEVAYFLAKNPKEAQRIASLHPTKAAIELGKLEVKLNTPPPKRVSSAPDPAKAPSGGGGGQPRKLEAMSQEDFYAKRKQQVSGR